MKTTLIAASIAALALSACATQHNDYIPPPADFPPMVGQVHFIHPVYVATACMQPVGAVDGCTDCNFDTGICTIYVNESSTKMAETLQDEYKHLKGFDHPNHGGYSVQLRFRQWKQSKRTNPTM